MVIYALAALLGTPANAADKGEISLSLGSAGIAGTNPSVGIAGSAMLGFAVSDRVAVLVGGREGIATGDTRIIGAVDVDVAYDLSEHWFVRGGFAHHHETPWADYLDDPLGAMIGSGEGIRHRTGGSLGLGYSWELPAVSTAGMHYAVWLSAIAFPDDKGSQLYGVLEHQFTFDFGKKGGTPAA